MAILGKVRFCWFGLVLPFLAFASLSVQAESLEYKFQAVYFFNFLRYTEWPLQSFSGANTPIVIGVLGENPFGTALDEAIKNESIQGRPVVVKYFRHQEDLQPSHALYISKSEEKNLARLFPRLENASTLLVSDMEHFTERGGHIRFFSEKESLRFEINTEGLKRAQLKLSSQLLKLARVKNKEGKN